MRNKLIAFGLIIAIYFVFVLNAIIVWRVGTPEEISNYYIGESGVVGMVYSLFAIVPIHLALIVLAIRKRKVEWYVGLPLFLVPYMVGVIIQGLIY